MERTGTDSNADANTDTSTNTSSRFCIVVETEDGGAVTMPVLSTDRSLSDVMWRYVAGLGVLPAGFPLPSADASTDSSTTPGAPSAPTSAPTPTPTLQLKPTPAPGAATTPAPTPAGPDTDADPAPKPSPMPAPTSSAPKPAPTPPTLAVVSYLNTMD